MGKVELMQEKISQQRKLPKEIKEKLNIITFENLLISILVMIYMIAVNLLFFNETEIIFSTSIKVSAITLAVLDIVLFEIAYRKENATLAIHGIELLCFSLFVLLIPYIYFYLNPVIIRIVMLSAIFFSIYYVGKAMLIHVFENKKYINNLSDVLEILQDDTENESYLDEYDFSEEEITSEIQKLNQKNKEEQKDLKSKKTKSE